MTTSNRAGDAPALSPPVEVMRPKAVSSIPSADSLPGGVRFELKADGFRCLSFARSPRPAYLQSRSGRSLGPGFPSIVAAVNDLPAGLVLDGELCAWHDGRLAFDQLLRSRAAREAARVQVSYVVFDVLAFPGRGDVRPLPLRDRVGLLEEALADVGPPIEAIMATTDEEEARIWFDALVPQGIEGLVCKSLDSPYLPRGSGRAWLKVRSTENLDVLVTGFTGAARRPRALALQFADGSRALSSPQLDPLQARLLAETFAGQAASVIEDPDFGVVHMLDRPLPAEVRAGTGRHATYRYQRLRGD